MRYKKFCVILIFNFSNCFSQARDIKIVAKNVINRKDTFIRIDITNISKRTFYYSLGISAIIDTNYIGLTANMDAMDKMDVLSLKPIMPNKKIERLILKKKIFKMYNHLNYTKLSFFIIYFLKNDFNSKNFILHTPPI